MGTKIDDLINNISSNKLSSEENSMVDSIINDLNIVSGGAGNRPPPNQQYSQPQHPQGGHPPQMTEEERQMLIKQQQQQQQMMYEQQKQQQKMREMQQMEQQQKMQQMQQQQKEQMEKKMNEMKQEIESKKDGGFLNHPKINKLIGMFKNTLVVFLLIIFFNVNSIDEFLRFRKYSLFYNIKDEKSTLLFTVFKAVVISSLYYMVTTLLK